MIITSISYRARHYRLSACQVPVKKIQGQVNIASTCPSGQVIFWTHCVKSCFKILYKTRKYFADIDDLIVCQSKTEALRNVDSQNKIADLIGIKVHRNQL